MSKNFHEIAQEVASGVGLLQRASSDAANAFRSLAKAATATKALDTKTKELMALAIGITTRLSH
jgi:alkylhydroperoxidase/carboxymuconolactone decarboxylase family protein YurZ